MYDTNFLSQIVVRKSSINVYRIKFSIVKKLDFIWSIFGISSN